MSRREEEEEEEEEEGMCCACTGEDQTSKRVPLKNIASFIFLQRHRVTGTAHPSHQCRLATPRHSNWHSRWCSWAARLKVRDAQGAGTRQWTSAASCCDHHYHHSFHHVPITSSASVPTATMTTALPSSHVPPPASVVLRRARHNRRRRQRG